MQKSLSAFPLKVIAIAAMLLNHIFCGRFGFQDSHFGLYMFGFVVGKLTFPIMCWLLVEGYRYTRDVKRYALRLALFALASVFPFWWYFSSSRPFGVGELANNVLFTLLMGLLCLYCTDKIDNGFARGLVVLVFSLATATSDWALFGVPMIYGMHRIQQPAAKKVVPVVGAMAAYIALQLFGAWFMAQNGSDPGFVQLVVQQALGFLGMLLPVGCLLLYNGKRGYSPAWVKWGFYMFYPLHLLVLGFVYHFAV